MKNYDISQKSTVFSTANDLDHEWLELIIQAKRLGITKEEVRNFLVKKVISA